MFCNAPAFIGGGILPVWDGANLPAESHNSNVPRSVFEGHGVRCGIVDGTIWYGSLICKAV